MIVVTYPILGVVCSLQLSHDCLNLYIRYAECDCMRCGQHGPDKTTAVSTSVMMHHMLARQISTWLRRCRICHSNLLSNLSIVLRVKCVHIPRGCGGVEGNHLARP